MTTAPTERVSPVADRHFGAQQVGERVCSWIAAGEQVAFARVLELHGFSTWAADPIAAFCRDQYVGELLGTLGRNALTAVLPRVVDEGGHNEVVGIEVHGSAVAAAGLTCGGRADVLVQPACGVPLAFFDGLARRMPVALVTRIDGASAGPSALVVHPDGSWTGSLDRGDPDHLARQASALLARGATDAQRIDDGAGTVLLETWVPDPRMVVVGDGDLLDALVVQAALLGWETRAAPSREDLADALQWAGGAAAVVVLSHDSGLDVAALRSGLESGAPYVGAMGSRRTQSRRLDALRDSGVGEESLALIRRPIGLDLGGRRPVEVALAIVAEILAAHCGRDGGPLRNRPGPIHGSAPSGPI